MDRKGSATQPGENELRGGVTAAGVLDLLREEGLLEFPADFPEDGDLFAAGLDSMAVMQLIVVVEERYGVALGAADASPESLGTAERLAETINARA